MLSEFAAVLDRLYDPKRRHKRLHKPLAIVVGNGIWRIANILNDDQVRVEAKKRHYKCGSKEELEFKWRLFEYARYHTANALPTILHCCIHRLLLDGICSDLITTNYDLAFDSIWAKYPNWHMPMNPVCRDGEYLWEGYYSHRKQRRAPHRYWKIHGSLSHVVFRSLTTPTEFQLTRLPRFAVATNYSDIGDAYGLHTIAPFLGFEQTEFPHTLFPNYDTLGGMFAPFIDWTYANNRDPFKREIDAVTKLLKDKSRWSAILLIGFRGFHDPTDPHNPWNEELTPVLLNLIDDGCTNIFMAVHQAQYGHLADKESVLMRRLEDIGRCASFDDMHKPFVNIFARHSHRFPYALTLTEYKKWANYWYINTKERSHG